jgi:hypothetical protein
MTVVVPPHWSHDTPLSTKVGTKTHRLVAVAQPLFHSQMLTIAELLALFMRTVTMSPLLCNSYSTTLHLVMNIVVVTLVDLHLIFLTCAVWVSIGGVDQWTCFDKFTFPVFLTYFMNIHITDFAHAGLAEHCLQPVWVALTYSVVR